MRDASAAFHLAAMRNLAMLSNVERPCDLAVDNHLM
jgi:hypothetical protein